MALQFPNFKHWLHRDRYGATKSWIVQSSAFLCSDVVRRYHAYLIARRYVHADVVEAP